MAASLLIQTRQVQHHPAAREDDRLVYGFDHVAKVAGFSLHAGVAIEARQRDKLERLKG